MKKYLRVLMALTMVLGVSRVAMAQLASESVDVYANVGAYCALQVTAPSKLEFEGRPYEEQKAEDGTITKDCNCNTILTATVTEPLTLENAYGNPAAPRILTAVDINGIYSDYTNTPSGPNDYEPSVEIWNPYDGTVHTASLSVRGKLGEKVSSQPAGWYSGVITVTVSAAWGGPGY